MGPKVFKTITLLTRSKTNGFSSLPDKDTMLYFVVLGGELSQMSLAPLSLKESTFTPLQF